MCQTQRPTAVDGCARETTGKSRMSRIGVHHSKCFLLERRRLADSLLMVLLKFRTQRAKADF